MLSVKDEIVGAIPGFKYSIADPGWRFGTPDRPGSIVTSTTCHRLLAVQLFLDVGGREDLHLLTLVVVLVRRIQCAGAECDTSRKCEQCPKRGRSSIKLCVSPPARQFGDEDDPPARFDRISSGFSSRTLIGSVGWTRNSIKCP
jgi:hypothetical protein